MDNIKFGSVYADKDNYQIIPTERYDSTSILYVPGVKFGKDVFFTNNHKYVMDLKDFAHFKPMQGK